MPINPERPSTFRDRYKSARAELDWLLFDNYTLVVYAAIGLTTLSVITLAGAGAATVANFLTGYIEAGLAVWLARLRKG